MCVANILNVSGHDENGLYYEFTLIFLKLLGKMWTT